MLSPMTSGPNKSEAVLSGWRGCYGVDLQGERCVAVRAERVHGRVVCSPVDGGAMDRLGAEGLPVVSLMGERESFTRWVEAPYGSIPKARKVFPTLLDIQLPFALDDCLYAFIEVARTPAGHCRGLAAAARRTHVSAKLAACEARGLDPMVLDQAGPALWTQALLEAPPAAPERPRIVAWLDETHATLVKGCGSAFESAHTLRVDDADRMRLLAMPADTGSDAPPEWILCGPAATPERVAALWSALGEPGAQQLVAEPAAFLARAIATRALLPGPYRCNLRRDDMAHAALQRRDRNRGRRRVIFALAAALLLGAADVAALRMLKSRRHRVERSVAAEIDALAGYHVTARGRDALRSVQDAVQERKTELAPFVEALQPGRIPQLVAVLEAARTNGLQLDAVLLSPERIEISGTSPDWTRCEVLSTLLNCPPPKRGEALASERIPFSVMKGGTP